MAFVRFQDLRVFRLAEQFADEVWDIVCRWNFFQQNTVGIQFVKAADSIGANIAEGAGRGTVNDNKRFVRIGRGSFNESHYWLRRCEKRHLVTPDQSATLRGTLQQLGPSLNGYLNAIGRNATRSQHKTPNTKFQTLTP